MLWRLQNGELDGVSPKIVVLMAGTNNVGRSTPLGDVEQRAADVARGVSAVVREIRKRAPDATVVITGITPRNDNIAVMPVINRANQQIAALADGKKTRYININEALALPDNRLREGMANDGLHLTVKAYQVWADALKPIFTEILGAPAAVDRAATVGVDLSAGWTCLERLRRSIRREEGGSQRSDWAASRTAWDRDEFDEGSGTRRNLARCRRRSADRGRAKRISRRDLAGQDHHPARSGGQIRR
jgi:hypothetical protein